MSDYHPLTRIRVEPYLFILIFSISLEAISITQLAQDKICRGHYHQTEEYCALLSKLVSSDNVFDFKTQILTEVTEFALFRSVITAIPTIFWSLFLGSWTDRHPSARKILMCCAAFGALCESIVLLINAIQFETDVWLMLVSFIPYSIVGGNMSFLMPVMSYISATSKPHEKTIRFAIIEALVFIASPLGIFIGGQLLSVRVVGETQQIFDYVNVFALGIITQLIAFFWILLVPLERDIEDYEGDRNNNFGNRVESKAEIFDETVLIDENDVQIERAEQVIECAAESQPLLKSNFDISNQSVDTGLRRYESVRLLNTNKSTTNCWHTVKDIFNLNNVRTMLETCFKSRTHNLRSQIWTLLISLTLLSLVNYGSNIILYQFVQKVFQWNAEVYSIVNSSALVFTSISVALFVPIAVKLFDTNDTTLSIIGTVSVYAQYLIRGTFLNQMAYYVSYIVGGLAFVPMISVRSKLSKIVPKQEVSQIFSLLATLETITPLVSSVIFSLIFNSTISSYPGLIFQFSCVIILIPLIGFISIHFMESKFLC